MFEQLFKVLLQQMLNDQCVIIQILLMFCVDDFMNSRSDSVQVRMRNITIYGSPFSP